MANPNNPNPASPKPLTSVVDPQLRKELNRLLEGAAEIEMDINKLKQEGLDIDKESYDLSKMATAELSKQANIASRQNDLVKNLATTRAAERQKVREYFVTQRNIQAELDELKVKKQAQSIAIGTREAALNDAVRELEAEREKYNIENIEKQQIASLQRIANLQKIDAARRSAKQNKQLAKEIGITRQLEKQLDLVKAAIKTKQDAVNKASAERDQSKAILNNLELQTQEREKMLEQTNKELRSSVSNVKETTKKIVAIKKEYEAQKQIVEELRKQKKVIDTIDETLGSYIWQFKNIKTIVMDIKDRGLNFWVAMLKISVDVLKQFLDRFKEVDAALGKFRDKTGITTSQMKTSTRDMSTEFRSINVELARFGVGMDEVVEAGAALTGEFQVVGLVTKEATRNAAMLAANLGISVVDTARLSSLFTKIAATSGMTMTELTGAAAKLAEMGGVAPNAVLKDMAEASEQTLTFLANNPMQLVRATVEARRLGTTINSISRTAKGLLNFQESITAELEASALVGKSLNFQEARLLAFQGKIIESRQSAMKQLEQIGDFTSLNLYQQEAIARAMNMTVDEIIKQQNQEKMLAEFRKNATGDDLKRLQEYDALQKKIADNEKDATKNLVNQGREFVKNANRQTQINQLTSAFKSMWTSLVDAAMPLVEYVLIPIVNFVQKAAKIISELPDGLKKTLAIVIGIGAAFAAIASTVMVIKFGISAFIAMRQLPSLISNLAGSANAATQATTALGNSLKNTTNAASGLGGAIKNAGGGLGGGALGNFLGMNWKTVRTTAAMMVILAGGIYLLGKSLVTFNEVEWASVGKGIAALGGLLLVAVAATKLAPAIAMLYALGAAAAFVGAAFMMTGKGIQLITSGFADLERARTERMQKIPESMASIVSASKQLKDINSKDVTKNVDAITESLIKLSKTGAGSRFSSDSIFNKLLQLAGAAGNLQSISNSLQNIQSISESMTKSISEKINASVNVIATTSIEVKNLNELKETVDKLISAISALGGAAGGATPVVNVTTNTAATVEKLTELINLLKEGKINAKVDLDKLNTVLNGKNVPAGR